MTSWMIYGANGYTGELIAREARRRGETPVLAGRDAVKITALGRELQLDSRIFALDQKEAVAKQLEGIDAVLHCAGPFVHTSAPMVQACLEAKTHYLDITGEIAVFEAVMARDSEARERGVTLLPGAGFDVVPSDCLAATLAQHLPSATELLLAFYTPGGIVSRGTMKTMIEGFGEGGAIRRDGKIVRVPTLFDVREIPFSIGRKTAMAIPWGDVSTAFHSTGIPNIRVYFATPKKTVRRLRFLSPFMPLLPRSLIKQFLSRRAEHQQGPDEAARAKGQVYLYGRVEDASGRSATATMTTPDGYAFTVLSAVTAVRTLLDGASRPGSFTPSRFFGAGFAETIAGVELNVMGGQ